MVTHITPRVVYIDNVALHLRLWSASGIAVKCEVLFGIPRRRKLFFLQVSLSKVPNIIRVFRSQFSCQGYNQFLIGERMKFDAIGFSNFGKL